MFNSVEYEKSFITSGPERIQLNLLTDPLFKGILRKILVDPSFQRDYGQNISLSGFYLDSYTGLFFRSFKSF